MPDQKLLRISDVMSLTGLKRSTIYLWGQQGRFPRPFKIAGSRAAAWTSREVLAWLEISARQGMAERDGASGERSAATA